MRVEADLLAIDQRDATRDDTFLFQPVDPPPAGGRRQPDFLAQPRHRQTRVLLQLAENLALERIKVVRSEEHTSELQSLMRISYAVFCLKKKTHTEMTPHHTKTHNTYK